MQKVVPFGLHINGLLEERDVGNMTAERSGSVPFVSVFDIYIDLLSILIGK